MKKPGINHPIICRKCGHKVGYVKLKRRIKWKTIWYGIGLALIFEIISNTLVYLIFQYGKALH